MTVAMEVLPLLDAACAECLELGPPPDLILAIPPPPLPAFLLRAPLTTVTNHSAANCRSGSLPCDWAAAAAGHAQSIDLTFQGSPEETWYVVLAVSFFGVVILGSLLAFFLLRLKHYLRDRHTKVSLQLDAGLGGCGKSKGCEVMYPGVGDPRVLWATLTPRGTTTTLAHPSVPTKSFDNSGFVDPDDYLRLRPRVSPPTRIEHPNLPPLNLHRTLRREGSSDTAPMV